MDSQQQQPPSFWEELGHQYDEGKAQARYGLGSPQFQAAADVNLQDYKRDGEQVRAAPYLLGNFPGFCVGGVESLFDYLVN